MRRTLAVTTGSIALALGAVLPTAGSAAAAPQSHPSHISARLCVWAGGDVVHDPLLKVCVGGLLDGRIVL